MCVRTLVLCIYASYGGAEGRGHLETGEFWVGTNFTADSLEHGTACAWQLCG